MKLSKIHIILFLLTVLTTFITGLSPELSVEENLSFWQNLVASWDNILIALQSKENIINAVSFSGALLFILGTHEMGHYYYGRKYGLDITPPYFIPSPPFISPIGTFGAFIKIKSPISTKKALFDIGIAGPIAGFIATIIVLIFGLELTSTIDLAEYEAGGGAIIGTPIILSILEFFLVGPPPEGHISVLHPVAFAGWVGLFVTALNLIPSGQLDGGHITYSLFSKKIHGYISQTMLVLLIIFGIGTEILITIGNDLLGSRFLWFSQHIPIIEGFPGWLLWAFLLILMGSGHPPTMYEESNLNWKRKVLGLVSLLIFIGCFTPVPIKIV